MSATTYRSLLIREIRIETDDTKSFVLEAVDGLPVSYLPGQFLTLVFHNQLGEEERRNYSISSSPWINEPLTITVKRIANGRYSRFLVDEARPGDILLTAGTSGFFTLPESVPDTFALCLFAAGSGITPVFSIIKSCLIRYPYLNIHLLYSNRSKGSAIFQQELEALQSRYPQRFHCRFLYSDAMRLQEARLHVPMIESVLQQVSSQQTLFYLCGPFEYMRTIAMVLQGNGVPAIHIRREIFLLEKPRVQPIPPDTDKHLVVIHGKETQAIRVQYPETILQAARKQGIYLPYSCESGQCGTCAASCIRGTVWMWRNEVLLDEELAAGRVLTCTGYPVGGDVELRF
jgi:ring-1,2-phenylacetyl-CoA epoxidase subunit PaaE